MSRVRTKTPRHYFVRVNGEVSPTSFDSLKLARKYVKDTFKSVVPNTELPTTVEIIKQVVLEEVMDVFTPQPMQILMATDLDNGMYK